MKTLLISTGLLAVIFLSASSNVEAQKRKVSKLKPPTNATVVSHPIKVLLRVREGLPFSKGQLNGPQTVSAMFIFQVMAAEVARPSLKSLTQLASGGRMMVEKDSIVDTQKQDWKLKLTDFDFVVNWEREWSLLEGTSGMFSIDNYLCKPERLRLSSSETWIVEKTSDPTVKNTWQISSYTLAGPLKYPDSIACMLKQAPPVTNAFLEKQVQSVIVPARSPVLKKLRAFINANTANKE